MNHINNVIRKVLNSVYPSVCPVCQQTVARPGVCQECIGTIKLIGDRGCAVCGKPLARGEAGRCQACRSMPKQFDCNYVLVEYKGQAQLSIYNFKYSNARSFAEGYARMFFDAYGHQLDRYNIDAVIPVPMSRSKLKKRGYNQAEVWAASLARELNKPLDAKALIRNRDTLPMKELSSRMRIENLRGAFSINKNIIGKYRTVLLVDDIFTTGATLDECALMLKKAGVQKVYGACIAAGD